ncbi:MAG TPA: UDP-N-acetylglucosamine 2-epimerase (non-hydrolyzing) [Candidatus Bathyarchaeia archaeon]
MMLVLGTRPQIIKSAPLIDLAGKDKQINLEIIHTGQHYDYEMTKIFFEELSLPDPTANLNVGSGTHAQQTAKIIQRLEKIFQTRKPDLILVPGDTNSTLAGAITATKMHIPVAHMESGARSYDMRMPEEINRRLTDHCSSLLFTPTENCTENLLREGVAKERIHESGDTMYDALLQQLPRIEKNTITEKLDLKPKTYLLLTIHRPENVDNPENLKKILDAMIKLKNITIVFPAHPRTIKQMQSFKLYTKLRRQKHVKIVEPVGYIENLSLINKAKAILTDSGGMQKEAFWLRTPCITLRENTEWVETTRLKANQLVGSNTQKIIETAESIIRKEKTSKMLKKLPNPFGDGKASQKIIDIIKTCRISDLC